MATRRVEDRTRILGFGTGREWGKEVVSGNKKDRCGIEKEEVTGKVGAGIERVVCGNWVSCENRGRVGTSRAGCGK